MEKEETTQQKQEGESEGPFMEDCECPPLYASAKKVTYCGGKPFLSITYEVCKLPVEYCEFGPSFTKCIPWILKNAPDVYPKEKCKHFCSKC